MKAPRNTDIAHTYEYRDEILRLTTSMVYTRMFMRDEADLESREDFLAYLREIDRCMGNEGGNDGR